MHCAADGAAGAGGFVAAFGVGLAVTRVEDGDHGGADCFGGLRDGRAFPGRPGAPGGMAPGARNPTSAPKSWSWGCSSASRTNSL